MKKVLMFGFLILILGFGCEKKEKEIISQVDDENDYIELNEDSYKLVEREYDLFCREVSKSDFEKIPTKSFRTEKEYYEQLDQTPITKKIDNTFYIPLDTGNKIKFTDIIDGGDSSHSEEYKGQYKETDFYVVFSQLYEDSGITLINKKNGSVAMFLNAQFIPIMLKDKKSFFALISEQASPYNVLQLITIDGNGKFATGWYHSFDSFEEFKKIKVTTNKIYLESIARSDSEEKLPPVFLELSWKRTNNDLVYTNKIVNDACSEEQMDIESDEGKYGLMHLRNKKLASKK